MILDFRYWSRYSKNEKLESCKREIESLDQSLRTVSQRHDRLMAHLGLVEIDGPRIVALSEIKAGVV